MMEQAIQIEKLISGKTAAGALALLAGEFSGKAVFSTSFSNEDQVITHLIAAGGLAVKIFTLDTGRMFAETYTVWNSLLERYGMKINAYYPQAEALEKMLSEKGPNSFYQSVENRKECCFIRKVEPLKRALKGNDLWITGIRAEHSASRNELKQVEWDEENKIYKFHPLLHWSRKEVDDFIAKNNIPCNALYSKGYASIGCAPCTRAIKQGEDIRAGRWWWEQNNKKECGLHTH